MSRPLRVVLAVADPEREQRLRRGLAGRERPVDVVAVVGHRQDLLGVLAHASASVLVLDLALPGGGQQALKEVMRGAALPVAVVTDDPQGRRQALAAGAVEAWDDSEAVGLAARCHLLSRVGVISRGGAGGRPPVPRAAPPPAATGRRRHLPPVVAVGASTGGPPAVAELLSGLAGLDAPVLLVQHIGATFVDGLVQTLAGLSALPVEVARPGVTALPGRVYVAPPDAHLRLRPGRVLATDPEPASLHVPSVDELFASVALCDDVCGIGVLMTGMGRDGARGLLDMRERGHLTLAQDEATSAVFGMPQAAQQLHAVGELLPLDALAGRVLSLARGLGR